MRMGMGARANWRRSEFRIVRAEYKPGRVGGCERNKERGVGGENECAPVAVEDFVLDR
jgi:hypothetical protein